MRRYEMPLERQKGLCQFKMFRVLRQALPLGITSSSWYAYDQ